MLIRDNLQIDLIESSLSRSNLSQPNIYLITWVGGELTWVKKISKIWTGRPVPADWWTLASSGSVHFAQNLGSRLLFGKNLDKQSHFTPDPPENYHLNVKKIPKTWHFFQKNWQKLSFFSTKLPMAIFGKKKRKFWQFYFEKMSSFWQFFDIQMAIFRRVRMEHNVLHITCA